MKSFLLLMLMAITVKARPQSTLVTTAPQTKPAPVLEDEEDDVFGDNELSSLKMSEFHVKSEVQFRYARTHVQTYLKNPSTTEAEQLKFSMIIPNSAFVSNFSLIINDGTEYVAQVKEKEEAAQTFKDAAAQGNSAGLVRQNARDANRIDVSVSVEPRGKVRFKLQYEELLERRLGKYEQIVHVEPGQLVPDFLVEVFINESRPISSLEVPEIKENENDITSQKQNPLAQILRLGDNDAYISFRPSLAQQKTVNTDNGISGQFIIQYDVERAADNNSGEIQLLDGYFVHFFAPDDLVTRPKHVIFVLDVSGSMMGEKLDQTKDAMISIIDDLDAASDSFNILTFSDDVYHWIPESEKLKEGPHKLTYPADEETRDEALSHVLDLRTIGGTNINDALIEAISLAERVKRSEEVATSRSNKEANTQSIIVFLTDGEATTGVTNNVDIKKNVEYANALLGVPIFGLAFGRGADFSLVRELALENDAFARRIYEGSDAALQLEDFFAEIANPLLTNVNFTYVGQFENVTATQLGTFNKGKEFVIAGKIEENANEVEIIIEAKGVQGNFVRKIGICPYPQPRPIPLPLPLDYVDGEESRIPLDDIVEPIPLPPFFPCFPHLPDEPREPRSEHENFIERLWAFKTVNELLSEKPSKHEERRQELTNPTTTTNRPDRKVIAPVPMEKTGKEKAVDLALQYNFVTPVTSLVVVKPGVNETEEAAKEKVELVPASSSSSSRGQPQFSAHAFSGGFATRNAAGGGFGFSMRRKVANRGRQPARPQYSNTQYSARPASRPQYSSPPVQISAQPAPASQGIVGSLFGSLLPAADSDYDDYESDSYGYGESSGGFRGTTTTTTTTRRTTCQGSVSLHDKTYFRGQNVTITADTEDLTALNVSKLFSVEVRGDCCWRIFVEQNFQGEMVLFNPGEHPSPTSGFKKLFRKVSSVQKEPHCF